MDAKKSNGRDKFPEPQGWALRWSGFDPMATDQEAHLTGRQSGKGRVFPKPRSWAAQWDGSVLSGIQDWYNERSKR